MADNENVTPGLNYRPDLRSAAQAVVDAVQSVLDLAAPSDITYGDLVPLAVSTGALRAALDAAPPAGLRGHDDLRLRWLRTFHDATSGLCNDDPCHVAWLIDLLNAAPSCGHPIDAEETHD